MHVAKALRSCWLEMLKERSARWIIRFVVEPGICENGFSF